jgi:hypothetical protein
MKRVDCEFESEVLGAVVQSRWPHRVDPELRAHVESCEICAGVAAIAGVIDDDKACLRETAVIPNSGKVWWLAQMRARRDAEAAAARPITAVQVVAFAAAMVLLGACFGATSTWFQALLKSLSRVDVYALLLAHETLVVAIAALLFLVPAAVYFAIGRD